MVRSEWVRSDLVAAAKSLRWNAGTRFAVMKIPPGLPSRNVGKPRSSSPDRIAIRWQIALAFLECDDGRNRRQPLQHADVERDAGAARIVVGDDRNGCRVRDARE